MRAVVNGLFIKNTELIEGLADNIDYYARTTALKRINAI